MISKEGSALLIDTHQMWARSAEWFLRYTNFNFSNFWHTRAHAHAHIHAHTFFYENETTKVVIFSSNGQIDWIALARNINIATNRNDKRVSWIPKGPYRSTILVFRFFLLSIIHPLWVTEYEMHTHTHTPALVSFRLSNHENDTQFFHRRCYHRIHFLYSTNIPMQWHSVCIICERFFCLLVVADNSMRLTMVNYLWYRDNRI